MLRCVPLLLLLACDGGDTSDTDGPPDADGDGWDETLDCDDARPDVYPGATEICDGVDNDCDGEVDDAAEGTRTFYEDADEDGYGNPNRRVFSCYPTGGFVLDDSDCNDTDPEQKPGADEVCDRIDNDCDGEIDEDPIDGNWWYPDADRDGYGGDADRVMSCTAVGGHLPTGGDCDDTRRTINPDGIEICDSRDMDEDCDGLVDDEDDSVTELIAWYVDVDEDGYGDRETPIFQCAEPDGRIDVGLDCRDDLETVNPDQTEICGNGLDDDCNDHAADCGVVGAFGGDLAYAVRDGRQAGGAMGMAMLGPGDYDGNGKNDLISAAPLWDDGKDNNTGQIYYFTEPGPGVLSISDASDVLTGLEEYARYGRALALADDLVGDSRPELVVGSPGGSVEHVYIGELAAGPEDVLLELSGPPDRSAFGETLVWTADVTSDGVGDLWIGGPDESTGGLRSGGAWFVSGALTGEKSADDDGEGFVTGTDAGERCGVSVAAVDLDGDGVPSLLMGCNQSDVYKGRAVVFNTPPVGAMDTGDADGFILGVSPRHGVGAALSAVGDIDEDGYDDFVIGSPGSGGSAIGWEGAAYLWLGEVGSTWKVSDADATFEGDVAEDAFGAAVAGGDLDGDDVPELIIGAPRYGLNKRGRVYVYSDVGLGTLAPEDAVGTVDGEDDIDNFGGEVSVSPSLTGDSFNSLLVGAHNRDAIGEGSGAIYIFRGGPGY